MQLLIQLPDSGVSERIRFVTFWSHAIDDTWTCPIRERLLDHLPTMGMLQMEAFRYFVEAGASQAQAAYASEIWIETDSDGKPLRTPGVDWRLVH